MVINTAAIVAAVLVISLGCNREKSDDKTTQSRAQPQPSSPTTTPSISPRPKFERPSVSPEVAQWPGYVAVTRGVLGFRTPDKKFYALGINADAFIRDFGPQDSGGPNAFLDYYADGLKVQLDNERATSGYIFHMGGRLSGKFHAANLMTDGGIKVGATFREVVKAHGEPTSDERSESFRYVNYPWGTFIFYDDVLDRIYVGGPGKPRKVD